jgi:hypothetical protein
MSERRCACGARIPLSAQVDGKVRNLQSRRRCLACLPFGVGRWSGHKVDPSENAEKKRKRATAWYRRRRSVMGRCPVADVKARRKKHLLLLAGATCRLCGYNKCPSALHFHHIDSKTKSFALSAVNLTKPLPEVLDEMRKCVLLCGNCHSEVHAGMVTRDLETLRISVTLGKQTWKDIGLTMSAAP